MKPSIPAYYYKDKIQFGLWHPKHISDEEILEEFKRAIQKCETLEEYELDSYTVVRRAYMEHEDCTAIKGWFKRRSKDGSSKEGN